MRAVILHIDYLPLRIPMRGYEFRFNMIAFAKNALRIPMRGYERGRFINNADTNSVTNPHEGL